MSRASRDAPAVRGRYMQTFLKQIRTLPEADVKAILAAMGPEIVASIDDAGLLAWLPLEVNLAAVRAVAARLGSRGAHEFFHRLQRESFTTPILSGIVNTVVRTLGRDPHVVFRWVGKGYSVMFRSAGEWTESDVGEKAVTLELHNLPPAMVGERTWLNSVSSSLHAVLEVAQVDGAVTFQGADEKTCVAIYRARWA